MPATENTESLTERSKILIISDAWHPQVNGVVRTYEHLSDELKKAGHDVRVIGPGDFPYRINMPGYSEIELTVLPRRRLARLITAYAPDYLHIATEGPLGWAARDFALRNNIRFTTAYHTQFPVYVAKRVEKILPFLAPWSEQKATAFIRKFHQPSAGMVITTPSMRTVLEGQSYDAPMHCMARGVPVDRFTPGDASIFDDMPRPVALYVGRVAIEKNLEDFLKMDWPGSKVVVGDGPSREALARKYPSVRFAGKKMGDDLAAHYRSADLFVFPSRTDTFGIVLLEALASGLPVAAYDVTGPRDIITHPHLGHVHADDLSEAARQAMVHADKAQHRHDHVRAHYGWPAIARQFMDILTVSGKMHG
ncbi:MAG: glycosyltransferase family 1 protein [Rhodospirillales bacterium]|nr:glycosyltransferase family 1 protein [Rhodospirillales bacterium]